MYIINIIVYIFNEININKIKDKNNLTFKFKSKLFLYYTDRKQTTKQVY